MSNKLACEIWWIWFCNHIFFLPLYLAIWFEKFEARCENKIQFVRLFYDFANWRGHDVRWVRRLCVWASFMCSNTKSNEYMLIFTKQFFKYTIKTYATNPFVDGYAVKSISIAENFCAILYIHALYRRLSNALGCDFCISK